MSSLDDRLALGATSREGRDTTFLVWAPDARTLAVIIEHEGGAASTVPLRRRDDGYFDGEAAAPPGTRYRLTIDGRGPFPDPASRFQPEGPFGASVVVDPLAFRWTDDRWRGPDVTQLAVYEMHVGTFTPEGTWRAAQAELPRLRTLGITAIEMMPVADFPGRFGWGYDGVSLFAPTRLYGEPDDLRAFVDAAHALGLAVILDVVYNHVGVSGSFLGEFSAAYYAADSSEWGPSFNFDGERSGPVREFVAANAAYWIREFHFDGLRLDAVHAIRDRSKVPIVRELAERARAAAGDRRIWIVAEDETQQARLARPVNEGGAGLDALWNDDFHHSARVAAGGAREGYYTGYNGSAQELVSLARRGYLYQGQPTPATGQPRGADAYGLPPSAFVCFLQNHDQIANSLTGERLHQRTSPGRYRALTALLLLGPWTPLLFQGDEFAAASPFLFFADHEGDLAQAVAQGRRSFLEQFPSVADAIASRPLDPPHAVATFERCRLDPAAAHADSPAARLHHDLLALRHRERPALADAELDGAVLAPHAFVLRYYAAGGGRRDDRLLVVNLGVAVDLEVLSNPLLAAPERDRAWTNVWTSESPRYGGLGAPALPLDHRWRLRAECAYWLACR